ncbi:MAG: CDP-diacylglycerol--glycerol-3-phosphate 3-phosphatidyltransferase [Bifidobacteriaceae bacterium]|nr:CDP-diacylglycerol--glycerol-3-phosphate 3-phosphatidyltransferase [Bifidobacteriaceae bacterium]
MSNDVIKHGNGKKIIDDWNTLPNLVTFSRIALVVVYLVFLICAGPFGVENNVFRLVSAILFIVAASTDKLDGYLARKRDEVTDLGKLMDPIADKLLICATLIVLSFFGELAWWITALFLIREIGITVLRFFVIEEGGKVIAASQLGKYKTLTQCLGLALLLLVPVYFIFSTVSNVSLVLYYAGFALVGVSLALCLFSGGMYVYNVVKSGALKRSREE